jgi:hypothetical protein
MRIRPGYRRWYTFRSAVNCGSSGRTRTYKSSALTDGVLRSKLVPASACGAAAPVYLPTCSIISVLPGLEGAVAWVCRGAAGVRRRSQPEVTSGTQRNGGRRERTEMAGG